MTLSTALAVFELVAGVLGGVGLGWTLHQTFATLPAPVAPFDREHVQAALMAAREGGADIEALVESLRPQDRANRASGLKCSDCKEPATIRYALENSYNPGHYGETRLACPFHWKARQGHGILTSEPVA